MITSLLALLIGVIAGLRTFTAPAAVSWAAYLGWLPLGNSVLAFLGSVWAVAILTAMVFVESVVDQLPSTASRTVPIQFGGRIVTAAIAGAAIAAPVGLLMVGGVGGIVGAVIGTLGGHAARARLAASLRSNAPAGLIEDAVAIVGAILIVIVLR
jgi:uncharacterized membrane protein